MANQYDVLGKAPDKTDRDLFISILATFGIAIVFQQLMNFVFGADVVVAQSEYGTTMLFDNSVTLPNSKIFAAFISVLYAIGLVIYMRRSRLGRAIRATAQNASEAEFYTGIKITNEKEAKQAAEKLLNLGIKKVIITLGEKGLFYTDGKEEIYLKASSVKAIDTTGAGDAFNGGLAHGLSKDKPINECLELANKVAGISTTKLGAHS